MSIEDQNLAEHQSGPKIEVIVGADGWSKILSSFEFIDTAARLALHSSGKKVVDPTHSVAILLSSDNHVRELNKLHRGKDQVTNVLSFPANQLQIAGKETEPVHIGDIIVGLETIIAESENQNKTIKDHVTHLVIHAVLHILGYNHESEREAKIMENLETDLMKKLGLADPYRATFN